jgi:hypothetical protein
MMVVPNLEVGDFLRWVGEERGEFVTAETHFPMSSKVYGGTGTGSEGDLCSFTTIVPGKAKGKDDYWNGPSMCAHLAEVSYIFKWVHRPEAGKLPPEMHAIFDGSSNHGARAGDGLRVGAGINMKPGGINAPGARSTVTNPGGVEKMRDGWYLDENGQKVAQEMHRQKTWMDDTGNKGGPAF